MILHEYSFKSFVVLRAEYFDAPLSTAKWCKDFLWLFFYLSTITSQFSVTWNPAITYFLPVQQKSLSFKIFPLFYTPFFYTEHFFFFQTYGNTTKITHVNKSYMAKHTEGWIYTVTQENSAIRIQVFFCSTVSDLQAPKDPSKKMLWVSTLSWNTVHCISEWWSLYSL